MYYSELILGWSPWRVTRKILVAVCNMKSRPRPNFRDVPSPPIFDKHIEGFQPTVFLGPQSDAESDRKSSPYEIRQPSRKRAAVASGLSSRHSRNQNECSRRVLHTDFTGESCKSRDYLYIAPEQLWRWVIGSDKVIFLRFAARNSKVLQSLNTVQENQVLTGKFPFKQTGSPRPRTQAWYFIFWHFHGSSIKV